MNICSWEPEMMRGGPTPPGVTQHFGANFPWVSWDFPHDVETMVLFTGIIPEFYVANTKLRGIFSWVSDGVTAGGVVWRFYMRHLGHENTKNPPFGDPSSIAISPRINVNSLHKIQSDITLWDWETIEPGHLIQVLLQRVAGHPDDDYEADAMLIGFGLKEFE